MLLEKLQQYADRLDLSPPMYQKTPIRWLIDLDHEGNLLGFVPTTGEGKKEKNDRGKEYEAPHIARSAGVRAKLLADTGKYVLGLAGDKDKQERVNECHLAFVEQVKTCATATHDPFVLVVQQFLEKLDRTSLVIPDDFNPSHNLTFRIDGILPIHQKAVQNYWALAAGTDEDSRMESPADSNSMQCLICGETRPAVKRLPFKIKRIPGGQSSGMALISANAPAFESYGLEASLIAPTCQDCGERFSKAANSLIESEDTHITIGPLVYLFWTKDEVSFSVASLLSRPESSEVRVLIASAFSGQQAATFVDATPFYATALSASGGRVVVRDWVTTTVKNVQQELARYFALQQIVDLSDGMLGAPYGLFSLAASTVRDAKDLSPNVPKILLRVALKGGALPLWLLSEAVKRNRAEAGQWNEPKRYPYARSRLQQRIALIKMILLSQKDTLGEEDYMTRLDIENHDPAYLCGRLLAVLEAVQQAAIPGVNATVTDRFFGTASSAPASVFGHLIRGAMAHLGKLRKEKPGTYRALSQQLAEVQEPLTSFPKTLTLEQQGLFGLGYFHQKAADRAAAIAYQQAREQEKEKENSDSTAQQQH